MLTEYSKTQQVILVGLEKLIQTRATKTTNSRIDYAEKNGDPVFATEYDLIFQSEVRKETDNLIQYLNKMMDGYFQTY